MKYFKCLIAVFGLTLVSVHSFSQNPNWEVDLSEYQFRMSVTAILERLGSDLVEGENQVAAFVGDELRGVGYPTSYHEPSDKYLAIFQIGSNSSSGETITFQIYDENEDEIVEARFTIDFEANEVIGNATEPYIISDNQFPTQITLSHSSIEENLDLGATPISISTTDGDDSNHSYSILNTNPEEFIDYISISDNNIQISDLISYEIFSEFTLNIQSTDELGGTTSDEFVIEIIDIPETPQSTSITNLTITENIAIGTLIGILSSEDEDINEEFSYALVTDSNLFKITGDSLITSENINYEDGEVYELEIETIDKDDLSIVTTFNVQVIDLNETPTVQTATIAIDENIVLDSVIITVEADDEDFNQTLTYALTDQENLPFSIDSSTGEISIDDLVNYEEFQEYTLEVTVTDNGSPQESATTEIIVSINDINEQPISINISNQFVEENTGEGTLVGSFSTTDEDFDETFTYELLAIENSLDHVSFNVIDDQLVTTDVLDKELTQNYTLRIKVTDSGENEWVQDISVFVIDLNESPILSDTSFQVNENFVVGEVIGQVIVTEPDEGQSLTYELVGSDLPFTIDETGVLTLSEELNYETQSFYNFTLKVVDDGVPSISNLASILITVRDINENPSDITITNNEVLENRIEGSFIGQLFTEDEDEVESFVYDIISVNGNSSQNQFEISNGRLFSTAGFNFESINTYEVLIQSFDKQALSIQKKFSIQVLDVNESPSLIETVFNVDENSIEGTEIGTIPFYDEDIGQNYTFTLLSSPFELTLENGILFTANPDELDYESNSEFQIRVGISDSGSPVLSDSLEYTILINDLPEERLSINNFISPNGDGFNDFLVIQNIEIYEGYILEVYNSSGIQILKAEQYNNDWAGTYKGEVIPSGIYFYSFYNPESTLKYEGELYVKDR